MNSVPRKLTLGLVLAVAAAACGDKVTVTSPPVVTPIVRSVIVSPSSATIQAGTAFTFGAAVDADATLSRNVTWTAAGGSGITVDANGVATAAATATGVGSICATSTANTAVKGCAQLTIIAQNTASATVSLDAITIGCDRITTANPGTNGFCGLLAPVSVNNVYGQIDVQVNVQRPIGSTVAGVEFAIICVTAPCAPVPGAVNAANTTAQAAGAVEGTPLVQQFNASSQPSSEGLAAQTTQSDRIVFSLQTADYNLTAAGAAVTTFTNGPKTARVRLCGSFTGTAPNLVCVPVSSTTASSAQRSVTFRNVNGFHVGATCGATSCSAIPAAATNSNAPALLKQTSAAGFVWIGGTTLTVTATPVNYNVGGVAALTNTTVNFGGNGCDLGSALATRQLVVATAVTGSTSVYSAAFGAYSNGGAAAIGNLNNYEMNPALAGNCVQQGESAFATGVDAAGNNFITVSLGAGFLGGVYGANNTLNAIGGPVNPLLATAPQIRLDNRGPTVGALTFINTPTGRTGGWMNDAVVLNATTAANATNGVVTANPADAGFGGGTVAGTLLAHVGTAAQCATAALCLTQPATTALGPAVSTTPLVAAVMPETITPVIDAFMVESQDAFGNRTSAAPLAIGVDRTAPTNSNNGSPADAAVIDLPGAAVFSANFADALSGFQGTPGAVSQSLIQVNGAVGGVLTRASITVGGISGGTGTISATPFATAGTAAAPTTTFVNTPNAAAPYGPPTTVITTTALPIPAVAGYYIYQSRGRDQAGNVSPIFVRRVYVNNGDVPLITGLNSTLSYVGGAVANFPGTAQSLVEVTSGELRLNYPNLGGAAADLIYTRPTPLVDPTFDDNMPMPASVPFSVAQFIRGIQSVNGTFNPQADFATAKPANVRGRVYTPFGNGFVFTANPAASLVGISGMSADFTAPILPAQVATGVDYNAVAAPTKITTWAYSNNCSNASASGTCVAPGNATTAPVCTTLAGGIRQCIAEITARGPTNTFLNPFTGGGIAVFEAATTTTNWRLVGGLGMTAAQTGLTTVTITPNFAAGGFPTLDNGVNRDFTWTITVSRVTGAATFDYRIVGLNATFDGLASALFTN